MGKVMWLDVSQGSENAGDSIISQAVASELADLGVEAWDCLPTHHRPQLRQMARARNSSVILVGGSNILSSHMERHSQWLLTPDLVAAYRGKLVLCGVGWWQYQGEPCGYTRRLLSIVLKPDAVHSVRDSYAERRLTAMGYRVINTGCPTMWSLPGRSRGSLETGAAGCFVTTLTNYNPDPELDRELLRLLVQIGGRVRFVAMAGDDIRYFESLAKPDGVEYAGFGVAALERELRPGRAFVGTRLHGGIRAMQRGLPTVVVEIDNRAREIATDTGLCSVPRAGLTIEGLTAALERSTDLELRINRAGIAEWKHNLRRAVLPGPRTGGTS